MLENPPDRLHFGSYLRALGEHGVTLLELVVGLALAGIAFTVAATLMTTLYGRYIQVVNRAAAVESQLSAAFHLRQAFGLAVEVANSALSLEGYQFTLDPTTPQSYIGQIKTGSYDHITACANASSTNLMTIALFVRETGGKGTSNGIQNTTSALLPTGIYYMCPTPSTSGVLFIDYGTATGVAGQYTLAPSYSKVFFDRIVAFDILPDQTLVIPGNASSPILTSLKIDITVRSFFGNPIPQQMNWCPTKDIQNGTAGCTPAVIKTLASYTDITETFQVTIGNQILGSNPSGGNVLARVPGNVRFFPFSLPW